MRTRFATTMLAVMLAALVAPVGVAAQEASAVDFVAPLSGGAEVPAVATDASGAAAFSLNEDGTELDYVILARGLEGVIGAHVHTGGPEENGGVLAPLFASEDGVDVDGTLVRGTVSEADVTEGTMDELVAAMRAGETYTNVHTQAKKEGEIRGQIAGLAPFDGTRFADDDGNVHERAIEIIAAAGIADGTNGNTFSPQEPISRGQMAKFLVEGLNLPSSDTDAFDDDDGTMFEDYVDALAAARITTGCRAEAYCPDDPISRGQMATLLATALDLTPQEGIDLFWDDDGVHEPNIDRLGMAGITQGVNPPRNTRYAPHRPVTRAQMATFLGRSLGWLDVDPLDALTILHNNDGESELVGEDGVGGVARFQTVLEQAREAGNEDTLGALLLSSGDNFLASTAFTASQEAGVFYDVLALEAFDYDAVALGNHDFDFGPQLLADFIGAYDDPPPYLSANLDFNGEPALQALVDAGVIQGSTMVEVGGRQIGIVGGTTEFLRRISSPGEVQIGDVAPAVQAEIDQLQAGGAEIVILISHLQSINEDLELAPELAGIDLMIAGGGDELLANDDDELLEGDEEEVFGPYPLYTTNAGGASVPVVTTSGGYRYLGEVVATFTASGSLFNVTDDSGPIAVSGQAQDPTLLDEVEEPVAAFQEGLATEVIATSAVDLDGQRSAVRTGETNEGDLIADALLWQARQSAAEFGVPEPDIAIQNGGGIRNDSIIPAGELTELDTFDMLPFPNFVTVVPEIPREQLKELLEHAVSNVENTDGRFAQIAGMQFTWDQDGTAQEVADDGSIVTEGSRIVSASLDDGTDLVVDGEVVAGDPVDLATIDFLAQGGDGYPFRDADLTLLATSYQQALSNYLQSPEGLDGTVTAERYPEGGAGRIIQQ